MMKIIIRYTQAMGRWTHRTTAVAFETWATRIREKKAMASRAKVPLRKFDSCIIRKSSPNEKTIDLLDEPREST